MDMRGHNNPPFDFIEFVRAVLLSSASTSQKLISVSIGLKAHDGNGTAKPRRSEITHMASCSEATFKRSYEALKVFFEVSASGAANTQYTPKSCITVSEIGAAISTMEIKKRSQNETGIGKRAQNDTTSSESGAKKRSQNDTTSAAPTNVPPHPPKNNFYNNTPLPPKRAKGRGCLDDPFGLNPHMRKQHEDVWFDTDDRLQVGNGFRIELEGLAGGPDQLRIELDRAAEWVGMGHPPHVLKAKVRGRIQSQLSDRKDRDRRYEKAKQQNDRSRSSGSVPIKLDDSDRPKTKPRPREEVEA